MWLCLGRIGRTQKRQIQRSQAVSLLQNLFACLADARFLSAMVIKDGLMIQRVKWWQPVMEEHDPPRCQQWIVIQYVSSYPFVGMISIDEYELRQVSVLKVPVNRRNCLMGEQGEV